MEKPLALSSDELNRILEVVAATGNDRLMVGFNRRFAPMLVQMRARFGSSTAGSVVRYCVNAGTLDGLSWYNDEKLEGSRFVGEGGHFIDTLSWWLGARPAELFAMGARDPHDIQINMRFDNGSIATITYATNGNPRYPKEIFEVASAGRNARMENFRRSCVWSGRSRRPSRVFGGVDKGQRRQLELFVGAVRKQAPMPIDLVRSSRRRLPPWRWSAAWQADVPSCCEPGSAGLVLKPPQKHDGERNGLASPRRDPSRGCGPSSRSRPGRWTRPRGPSQVGILTVGPSSGRPSSRSPKSYEDEVVLSVDRSWRDVGSSSEWRGRPRGAGLAS